MKNKHFDCDGFNWRPTYMCKSGLLGAAVMRWAGVEGVFDLMRIWNPLVSLYRQKLYNYIEPLCYNAHKPVVVVQSCKRFTSRVARDEATQRRFRSFLPCSTVCGRISYVLVRYSLAIVTDLQSGSAIQLAVLERISKREANNWI